MSKHFIDIADFSAKDLETLLLLAVKLKKGLKNNESLRLLEGKTLGLFFEKASLRTRVSFEVSMVQLGGSSIFLSEQEVGLGTREPVEDVARVLSRLVDIVVLRTFKHNVVKTFASYSTIPIINGLTDYSHPCQAIADFLTLYEHFGSLKGKRLCYIGDGNNVLLSLIELSEKLGVDITVSCPEGYEPETAVPYRLERDPYKAAEGQEVIYTDVWTSMGQEIENENRRKAFSGYTVNDEMMGKASRDAIFLHCLPAHRGDEVSASVFEGAQSHVFDQAENRLHAQKAIILWLLGIIL